MAAVTVRAGGGDPGTRHGGGWGGNGTRDTGTGGGGGGGLGTPHRGGVERGTGTPHRGGGGPRDTAPGGGGGERDPWHRHRVGVGGDARGPRGTGTGRGSGAGPPAAGGAGPGQGRERPGAGSGRGRTSRGAAGKCRGAAPSRRGSDPGPGPRSRPSGEGSSPVSNGDFPLNRARSAPGTPTCPGLSAGGGPGPVPAAHCALTPFAPAAPLRSCPRPPGAGARLSRTLPGCPQPRPRAPAWGCSRPPRRTPRSHPPAALPRRVPVRAVRDSLSPPRRCPSPPAPARGGTAPSAAGAQRPSPPGLRPCGPMPRRREVPALGSLCLQSLAQHMQSLWVRDYSDNYLDEFQFRFIMGPFNDLPGSAVQELLRVLAESRRLSRAALHLLLLPQLRELSLSPCPGLVSNGIARLLALRCQGLSSLDLRGCSRLSPAALEAMVEAMPRLQRLVLAATQAEERVLAALGRCCRGLRELDVSHCRSLAPRALRRVAFDPLQGRRCCPALRVLLARGLELLGDGGTAPALGFLLLALPCLQFLAHGAVPDALRLLHEQELDGAEDADGFPSLREAARWRGAVPGGPRLTLPLRHLEDVEESDLAVVRAMCPQAEEASVWLSDGTGTAELQRWGSLSRLTLGCAEGRALAGLVPVLRSLGPCLQSLTLHGFCCHDGLALAAVLAACPGLRAFSAELHLPVDTSTDSREPHEEPPRRDTNPLPRGCPQLQTFSLTLTGGAGSGLALGTTLSSTLTSLLCHAPCLQRLRLLAIPFPLDPVFQAVLAAPGPPLQELQELSLAGSCVSSCTVWLLLASHSCLRRMDLSRCRDIHRRDYDGFLQSVRKRRLDLDIAWE
ncbi:uncharacterized protein PRD47_014049 [Ara ararauna]